MNRSQNLKNKTMQRCRSCNQEIKFVRHITTSRWMCLELNPPPSLKPNISLSFVPALGGLVAAVVGEAEVARLRGEGSTVALDHHATCPNAGAHRGRK